MKLIASGVANCAASVRSPSFSRSSSSQTTTILPWRISSIACSIVANTAVPARDSCSCSCLHQPLHLLGEDVDLDVERARLPIPPRLVRLSVSGISDTAKPSSTERAHGQANAVERDRALLHEVARRAAGSTLDLEDPREALLADRARRCPCRPRGPARCARRGAPRRAARSSRFTRAPACRSPSEERLSVSIIASAWKLCVADARWRSGTRR